MVSIITPLCAYHLPEMQCPLVGFEAFITKSKRCKGRLVSAQILPYIIIFIQIESVNNTESRTGYRGEHGSSVVNLDRTSTDNYTFTDKDGMTYQGQMVQYGNGTGQFSGTVIGKDGKEYAGKATFYQGKPVHTAFQDGKTGEIVEKVKVSQGRGPDGKETFREQWSLSKVALNPNGEVVIHDKRTLSHEEVEKNGYATNKTVDTQNSVTLHERNIKGQNTKSEQKFTMDNKSNFLGNPQSIFAGYNTDYTALSDGQILGIMATDMIGDGLTSYRSAGGTISAHKGFSVQPSSGGTKIKVLRRPQGSGNTGSHPAAGSPARTLSPSKVNQTFKPQE